MDLADGVGLLRLAEGCGAILHFGGISVEQPFGTVLGPNIQGLYHVYEAARRERRAGDLRLLQPLDRLP